MGRGRGQSKLLWNTKLSHFWVGHNVFYASWEHKCPFGLFLPSRWWLFTTTINSSFNPLVAVTGVANLKAYKISRSSRLGVANLKAYKISRSSWLSFIYFLQSFGNWFIQRKKKKKFVIGSNCRLYVFGRELSPKFTVDWCRIIP